MPDTAKGQAKARTQAEIRKERLAAELRSNLHKRKQQARDRAAAATEPAEKRDEAED